MNLLNSKNIGRYDWIDSLRGISALIVLILHLWLDIKALIPNSFFKNAANLLIFGFTDFGKIGVVIFFFISGYLIPISLLNKKTKDFLIGRFLRLYPAYWFSILLFIIINKGDNWNTIMVNLTMFQKFIGFSDLIGVFWTLQIEWVFYLLCLLFFSLGFFKRLFFVLNISYFFILIALIFSVLRYYTDFKLPVALFLALSVMFLGMLLRFYEKKIVDLNRRQIIYPFIFFIIFLFPICVLAYNKDYGFQETWYRYFFSYSIAIGIFILFYRYHISNGVTLFLGRISYSLYLLHPICLQVSARFFLIDRRENLYFFTFSSVIGSILISYFSYMYIEKRFIKAHL